MGSTVEEVSEAAQNPYIPFLGRVELSLATGVALLVGAAIWSMVQESGDTLAEMAGNKIGSVSGFNPAQGQTQNNEPAFGGEA